MSTVNAEDKAQPSDACPTLASEALKTYSYLTGDDRSVTDKPVDDSKAVPLKPAWRLFRTGKGAQYDMAHVDSFLKFDAEHCRKHGLENTIFQLPIELCNVTANGRRRSLKVQGFLIWAELCERTLPPGSDTLKIIESSTNTALEFRPVEETCCWRYLNVNALNEKLLSAAVLFLRQIFEFNFAVRFDDIVRICYKCWRRQEKRASIALESIIYHGANPNCQLNCAAKDADQPTVENDQPRQDSEQPVQEAVDENKAIEQVSEKPAQEAEVDNKATDEDSEKPAQEADIDNETIPPTEATEPKVVPSDLLFHEDEVRQVVAAMIKKEVSERRWERRGECNTYSYHCTVRVDSRMFGPLIGKHGCTAGIIEHLTNSKVTFVSDNQASKILLWATNERDLDSAKGLTYLLAHGVLRFGNMYDTLARMYFTMSRCPTACKMATAMRNQRAPRGQGADENKAPFFKRHIPLDEPYRWNRRTRYIPLDERSRWNGRVYFKQGQEVTKNRCPHCSMAKDKQGESEERTSEEQSKS